jgi:putative phosphoesterase
MKLLIVSDNHGSTRELEVLAARHKGEIDYWIHCGDSEFDFNHDLLMQYLKVRGNMDYEQKLPNEITENLNGVSVYITHGHLFNIKMSLLNLSYRVEEYGAKIAFFGHSHIACSFEENGIVFINPGSISLPRGREDKSYAICELNDEINVSFFDEAGQELTNLYASYKLKGENL